MSDPKQIISDIKQETFERIKNARRVWIVEECGADFVVHTWSGPDAQYGPGVGPPHEYPTLRKAAARLLQVMEVGAVAPQTWPENVCIGSVNIGEDDTAA